MNTILNNIDTSNTSIVISFVIFAIFTIASKYLIDKYTDEDEDDRGWLSIFISPIIGFNFAILSMYTYKHLSSGGDDILTEPFNSKINIV